MGAILQQPMHSRPVILLLAALIGACSRQSPVSFARTLAGDGCVVERVAHGPGEHHFSFRGVSPDSKRIIVGFSTRAETTRGSYLLDLRTGVKTPLAGLNNGGSFSPDGRRIVAAVYVSRRNTEIVEHDIATGNTARIAPDSAADFLPSYSPDGRSVVFNSYRTGRSDLYLLDRETRALRRLTTFDGYDAHGQFSPDGRTILFHRQAGPTNYDLVLSTLATGEEHVLTTAPGEEAYPAFSPSGREVVFADNRDSTAGTDLYVASLDDMASRRILTLPTSEGYPTWSPDGRHLYFTSRDSTGTVLNRIAMRGTSCRRD